jgi:hypothetical protein
VNAWEQRDLPVLAALANTEDQHVRRGYLDISLARETLGLDLTSSEIHDAVLTLGDAGYVGYDIDYETGNGGLFTQLKVTGRGKQALGDWPLFTEVTPATLAALLDRLADEAPTDEEAENARTAATYIRSLPVAAFKAAMRTVIVEGTKASLGFMTLLAFC